MNNLLLNTLVFSSLAVAASPMEATNPILSRLNNSDIAPLARMRKAEPKHKWASPAISQQISKIKPNHSTPQSDKFQYLYGPDGSDWFAICNYDVETIELPGGMATEDLIKGYSFTIYDNLFNEVGSIHDIISFEEGETRCAQVMLDVTVTKKFFNYDDSYEIMVALAMNKADYTVNLRTKVYQLDKGNDGDYDEPIAVISGYPVDAINTEAQPWNENFYITFLDEKRPDPDAEYEQYTDYLAQFFQVLTTYKKAGMNGEAIELFQHEIPMLNLPGDQMNSPMMLTENINGKLTLVFSQYEKSYFVDPSGMGGNEATTPDNNLLIDVYQLSDGYPQSVELFSSTSIPATQNVDDNNVLYTFYGIGNLRYSKDVDFKNYSSDGSPCFIVSVDEYLISDDSRYNSSYYVYDVNGQRLNTLAENTFDYVVLSDIAGLEPQIMFIHSGNNISFEFVDLYSAQSATVINQSFHGYSLSTSIDRVPSSDGYVYASVLTNGIIDDDNNVIAPICWIDSSGHFLKIDEVSMGKNIEMAQIYMSAYALSPFIFNTDNNIEYMILAKRSATGSDNGLREELLIASADQGIIYSFLPDEEKGSLRNIYLLDNNDPRLSIVYGKDNKYIAETYILPFTKFAGGNGSDSNPYQIATAGDLQQIKSDVNAHYRIVSDIDCSAVSFSSINDFSGSLYGDGHTISNLSLSSDCCNGLFEYCDGASFENINFFNCRMNLDGNDEVGLIASNATNSKFNNIYIRNLNVDGQNFNGNFGSIAGLLTLQSEISQCEVAGVNINLPACEGAAGIVGKLRTGSKVNECAFIGKINAKNTVGGIVAETNTGDEIITNCHVDADLTANHTIGGIAGYLKRSKVSQNYVEGSIEATEPSKWNKTISVGGIAGELEGDWEGNGDLPVTQNLIGISLIKYPQIADPEEYPHQFATVHRVVGRTSYNAEPWIEDYDEFGNPIYNNKIIYEEGVINNLVLSQLPTIDNDFAEKTIEGTSIDKENVTVELLNQQLGFSFGSDVNNPWSNMAWNVYDPLLFFENLLYMPTTEINAESKDLFNLDIVILSRSSLSLDDITDNLVCEFNESIIEMTGNLHYADNLLSIQFKAIKEGRSRIVVSLFSGTASCSVKVKDNPVVSVDSLAADHVILKYFNDNVVANDCFIIISDINGRIILKDYDSVNVAYLPAGVYIATAHSNEGLVKSIKFTK